MVQVGADGPGRWSPWACGTRPGDVCGPPTPTSCGAGLVPSPSRTYPATTRELTEALGTKRAGHGATSSPHRSETGQNVDQVRGRWSATSMGSTGVIEWADTGLRRRRTAGRGAGWKPMQIGSDPPAFEVHGRLEGGGVRLGRRQLPAGSRHRPKRDADGESRGVRPSTPAAPQVIGADYGADSPGTSQKPHLTGVTRTGYVQSVRALDQSLMTRWAE